MVKTFFLFLAVIYTAAITYLSLIDLTETPVKDLGIGDKLMHIGAYFGMALLWLPFFVLKDKGQKFNKKIILICVAVTVFGIFIEVLQDSLTTYRTFDVYDALANGIGALTAGILAWILKKKH